MNDLHPRLSCSKRPNPYIRFNVISFRCFTYTRSRLVYVCLLLPCCVIHWCGKVREKTCCEYPSDCSHSLIRSTADKDRCFRRSLGRLLGVGSAIKSSNPLTHSR
ncbi:hypothetical protein VTH06DRAFT_6291 [Thermothelomyces fergusii]